MSTSLLLTNLEEQTNPQTFQLFLDQRETDLVIHHATELAEQLNLNPCEFLCQLVILLSQQKDELMKLCKR